MKTMAIGMVLFIQAVTVRWWKPVPGGAEYVVRNTLNHHHDRVCGVVLNPANADGAWGFYTLRSAGAREGLTGSAASEDEAMAAVAKDCR
jgi:hypothetical protein